MKTLLILIVLTTVLTSCGQEHEPNPDIEQRDFVTPNIPETTEIQKNANNSNAKYIDTKYVYVDSEGNQIRIVNSLPKGGLKYTDPMDREYVYAVFWTRIVNETKNPLEMTMDFLEESYQLPSSRDKIFKLFIPSDTLTVDKEPLFNYGLNLEEYLDNNFNKQAHLVRTINQNDSSGFYVVVLFNQGVNGTLRTELKINDDKLSYGVNDRTICCGEINLKQLKLKK